MAFTSLDSRICISTMSQDRLNGLLTLSTENNSYYTKLILKTQASERLEAPLVVNNYTGFGKQEDKEEHEGCSLQEKYENLTSEVAASTSIMDGRRLGEIINALGMHSFFSTSTIAASTPTMEDEGYTRRLIEIASLVIYEGNRLRVEEIANGLGMRSLFSTSTTAASTSTMTD
ncbi:hypothetical protein Tco_0094261, partial [Tanacetum coccineum]